MWRQANVAKVGLHFESILIRGLMNYAFWVPNGSPEYRYCLHESVEECNHTMMFQEMVNRIGTDVPGMPRMLKWLSQFIPLAAGPLPIVFFFGVLAGEEPIDHTQKTVLREGKSLHPIMERVMAIHVAEEARHISFAHEYLRKRVPGLRRAQAVPSSRCTSRSSCGCCARRSSCRRAASGRSSTSRARSSARCSSGAPESRQMLSDMFADVRMLCHDTGSDEPGGPADVADLPDRRQAVAVPQRAAAPAPAVGARAAQPACVRAAPHNPETVPA